MTQGPRFSDEQFATAATGSDFDTVDLGGPAGAPSTVDTTYVSSYTQPSAAAGQGAVAQAKDMAGDLVDQAQEKTGQVVDQARGVVASRIADQKDRAAGSLGGVAQALRQTSQQLRDQDQAGTTQYVDGAANQIERVASYLQHTDINDVFDDVEQFARRQPALFLGGAFALGLLGARFLKSSSRSSTRGNTGGSRSYTYTGGYQPAYRATTADYTRSSNYGGPAGYDTSATSRYDTGTTSGTTANVGDATGARSVGGMEER
jgi:hypothetical protein